MEAETLFDTVAELEVEEIVDTLADTQADVRPGTLREHWPT